MKIIMGIKSFSFEKSLLTFTIILFSFSSINAQENFPYKNVELSVQQRVTDLLSRMTLDEKISQMSMLSLRKLKTDNNGNVTKKSLKKAI